LTASATDTNSPQPMLDFSLLSGPASATLTQLNNTNAAFNWRPGVTNANTTNPVTLEVSDISLPNPGATQSFTITVNPLVLPTVSSVGWNNGQFTLFVTNSILEPGELEHALHHQLAGDALPVDGHQCVDVARAIFPHQSRPAAAVSLRPPVELVQRGDKPWGRLSRAGWRPF